MLKYVGLTVFVILSILNSSLCVGNVKANYKSLNSSVKSYTVNRSFYIINSPHRKL